MNSKIIADKRNHSIKTGSLAVRQGQHAYANTVFLTIEQESCLCVCVCAKPARDEEPTAKTIPTIRETDELNDWFLCDVIHWTK